MTSQIQSAVFKRKEAAKYCGKSIATLDRLRASGEFVRPIQLGTQAIRFLRADVENWTINTFVEIFYIK